MGLPRSARIILWLGAAGSVIIVQILVRAPSGSLLWAAVLDAGHAALFGLFALALLHSSLLLANRSGGSRIRHYLLAFALTFAASGLTEVFQAFGSRDADAWDFVRSVLGGTAILLLALAFDQKVTPGPIGYRVPRVIVVFLAAILLVVAFIPMTTIVAAYLQRDAAFPRICDFQAAWETKFVGARHAKLTVTGPPDGWGRDSSDRVGWVTFLPEKYPALLIREPYPDWTGYDRLVFEVYSELEAPVELNLRIHDVHHDNDYSDRFNRVLAIEPGANLISISLLDVQRAPRGRMMDLSRIRSVALFAIQLLEPYSLYVDAFHLERE